MKKRQREKDVAAWMAANGSNEDNDGGGAVAALEKYFKEEDADANRMEMMRMTTLLKWH